MQIENLLEVIQVQRHDFLNHLQVISGLLQLNKGDRVLAYINQVSVEIGRFSPISRLTVPEVKAVLLTEINEAAKHQIRLEVDIQTDLAGLNIPGPLVGAALQECITAVLKFLEPPAVKDRGLDLQMTDGGGKFTFRLGFSGADDVLPNMESRLREMVSTLSLADYRVDFQVARTNNRAEIFLIFPRRGAEIQL